MNQVIPFDQMTSMPAHLIAHVGAGALALNDAAEEFASVKFPVISIKGSRFHVSRDGEKTLIMRPKANPSDPDEPATYIEVTILNIQKAKTFYEDGYVDGAAEKPDCFSNDAITPDASVAAPQCSTCALCPQNAWGSGVNDKGEATKGKACSDVQRLAVAGHGLDDPMMLRVPPLSLKNLAEMSKLLSKKNIPINGVVTRVSFDTAASSPLMLFKPIGFLDAAGFAKAQSLMNDDLVLAIVGRKNRGLDALGAAPAHIAAAKEVAKPAADPEAAAKKAKADAKDKKVAAAKAVAEAAAKAVADAEGDDEDGAGSGMTTYNTDALAGAARASTAKPAKATASVATAGSLDAELDALLS